MKRFLGLLVAIIMIVIAVAAVAESTDNVFYIQNPLTTEGFQTNHKDHILWQKKFEGNATMTEVEGDFKIVNNGSYLEIDISVATEYVYMLISDEPRSHLWRIGNELDAKVTILEEDYTFKGANFKTSDKGLSFIFEHLQGEELYINEPLLFSSEHVDLLIYLGNDNIVRKFEYDGGFGEYTSVDGQYKILVEPVEDVLAELEAINALAAELLEQGVITSLEF